MGKFSLGGVLLFVPTFPLPPPVTPFGYSSVGVTTAGTIDSAYEAFESGEFDLIVSDIGLPDGTGLDLMRRAVALRGTIPSIALPSDIGEHAASRR